MLNRVSRRQIVTSGRTNATAAAGLLLLPLLAAAAAGCGVPIPTVAGPASDVRELTGTRTRLVWVQGDGTDPFAMGQSLILMGLDTDDPKGERTILGERKSYMKPMLTARGERVVFSSRSKTGAEPDVLVVNWDGTGLRRLANGFGLAVWRDPADGQEWVYAGRDFREPAYRTVVRFRLDRPGASELVWNKTPVSADSFQLSKDGRLAGGLFPWPEAGVAELPNRSLRRVGDGCWTALQDAGPRLFWYFDGAHRNLSIVDLGTDRRWRVGINGAPGFDNAETYHPRWSNHPRFLTVTGPYNQGGQNQVRSGGAQAEVWLGRFSSDYARVEAWARVTNNAGGDAYPDVWIDRDRSSHPVYPSGPIGPAPPPERTTGAQSGGAAAGAGAERLTVSARLVTAAEIPTPRSIAPYRNALVVNVYEVIDVVEGSYAGQTILVAQWAIKDARILFGARKAVGSVHRLSLEPYDAHPELEGERLIMGEVPDLRVFYDVGTP